MLFHRSWNNWIRFSQFFYVCCNWHMPQRKSNILKLWFQLQHINSPFPLEGKFHCRSSKFWKKCLQKILRKIGYLDSSGCCVYSLSAPAWFAFCNPLQALESIHSSSPLSLQESNLRALARLPFPIIFSFYFRLNCNTLVGLHPRIIFLSLC